MAASVVSSVKRATSYSKRIASAQRELHLVLRAIEAERKASEAVARLVEVSERISIIEEARAAELERARVEVKEGMPNFDVLLQRLSGESIDAYIRRIRVALKPFAIHHDAWYRVAAERWSMTERDFYSLIMSPKLRVA